MKNKISKKIIGGPIVLSILATIGVVLVSAEIIENDENSNWSFAFGCKHSMFGRNQFFPESKEE